MRYCSLIHSLAYSFVGIQTIYLSTFYDPVYWNTACLRVDSGLDEDSTSNYNKISKAVCNIMYRGIEVKPIDINKSQYMFNPDPQTGSILYGMKGLNGVGSSDIAQIIENRPFKDFDDFKARTNIDKTATVSLIKAGAFDEFGNREEIMRKFLFTTCNAKKRLTLQNFNALIENNLIPQELDFQRRLFAFNKALKANRSSGSDFIINGRYYDFFEKFFDVNDLVVKDNELTISQNAWKKLYNKGMEPAKTYLKDHQDEMLDSLNNSLLSVEWNKYADGNISSWEMDSMGYFYHDHVLSEVNPMYYGVKEFNELPTEPINEKEFNGIPIRKIDFIAGCVIAKDDIKSTVTLVTVGSGVVNVRMNREQYAYYNRRLSDMKPDGTKAVIENGFFQRGTLLIIGGFRRGDTFMMKTYKNTQYPQLRKITKINSNGTVSYVDKRANERDE